VQLAAGPAGAEGLKAPEPRPKAIPLPYGRGSVILTAMFAWLFSDPLPAGAKAPDFTLPDEAGHRVTLSALRGKSVVLVFYPGDGTPG